MGGRHRTDEHESGYTPYREPSGNRRAGRGKVLVPLAGAVALAVLLGVAAYVVMSRDRNCGANGAAAVALRVAASPDIEPAISRIATAYNKTTSPGGPCVTVSVAQGDPAGVTNAIAGSGATTGKFDADLWIPDSSLWVAKLRATPKGAAAVSEPIGSVARSPVVLAVPKPVVEKVRTAFGEPSWGRLMSAADATTPGGKVRVLPLDPTLNAAGLSALLAGAGVLKASGSGEDRLVGVLRQLSENAVSNPANLFATMTKQSSRAPIGIASEQAVWGFNANGRPGQITALYPTEGTISLDYPIVVTAKAQATREAAKSFATALAGASARQTIHEYGFRTPDGKAGEGISQANGLDPATPRHIKIPDAASVTRLSQAWSRLRLGGRLLALMDISGTMALPAAGASTTRMQLIGQTAIEGLKLFPDKTEIGTWEFSTHLNGKGVDYHESVPVGPLGARLNGVARRNVITRSLARIRAKPTGDTGLNDTLAAAYDKMKAEYEADKINTILVFTDGVGNDDPGGGISNAEILRKLRTEFDETQPVSVFIIALGADDAAGRRQMRSIAKATQGQAFFPENASEVRRVFLEGISRRLCAPSCNGGDRR